MTYDVDENDQNIICLGRKGEVKLVKNIFNTTDFYDENSIKIISAW